MAYNKKNAINKRHKILNKTNGKCIYCGCDLDIKSFHMEHVIPKSNVSGDSFDRLFPSCSKCNLYKHSLSVEQFRYKLENEIFERSVATMFEKYHKLKKHKIEFYFEKEGIDIYGTRCSMD